MREEQALREAMDLYGDTVYRLALCRLGAPCDAEDVYQTVFLRLFRCETSFRSAEHLKAWLIRVTVNCCRDIRKSAWSRHTVPLERAEQTPAEEPPVHAALWGAVAALPDQLRAVVYLHYVEGYTAAEIARMLGCPAATVRTRLYRARKQLRLQLEEEV